jgi:hypothetical protein
VQTVDNALRENTMKSRPLIVALSLTLAAGAAAAVLSRGSVEPASQAGQPCMEPLSADAIPRVVVIGHRPAATLAANRS